MKKFFAARPPIAALALAALAVFASALCVVYSAAHNRTLFAQLNSLQDRHETLVVRRGRLELEEWTLAAHSRVAAIAASQLGMQEPKKVRIVEVR